MTTIFSKSAFFRRLLRFLVRGGPLVRGGRFGQGIPKKWVPQRGGAPGPQGGVPPGPYLPKLQTRP